MMGDLGFGYTEETTAKYETACSDNDGHFVLTKSEEFVCREKQKTTTTTSNEDETAETRIKLRNVGSCFALTTECRRMDTADLMKRVWERLGLDCEQQVVGSSSPAAPTTATASASESVGG